MKIHAIYKISEYPLIYGSTGSKNWHLLKNDTAKNAYLLVHPMWEFSWTSLLIYFKHRRSLKKRKINMILLNNSIQEHNFAKLFGFESYFINQNIHSCEHNFYVNESVQKKYDAIYTATAAKYKRLELATLVKNLFVLTYFWPDIRNDIGEWDLHSFEPRISQCDFNRFRIEAEEICKKINESRCGLALSKKEGAMWAIAEYLLCGIPVVSTKSKGGRDFFFSNENSIICKDTPEAIKYNVEEINKRNYNPYKIRNSTLLLMKQYRYKYIELVFDLYKKNNIKLPNEEEIYFRIWGNEKGISNIRII